MGKPIEINTGVWLKDPKLSMCSPATRGIWFDMLCAMHELDRCGQLTGTYVQLGRISRCSSNECEMAVKELLNTKTADVTECNGIVTITNRRMNRAYEERNAVKLRVAEFRERQKRDSNVDGNTNVHETANPSELYIHISSNKSNSKILYDKENNMYRDSKHVFTIRCRRNICCRNKN